MGFKTFRGFAVASKTFWEPPEEYVWGTGQIVSAPKRYTATGNLDKPIAGPFNQMVFGASEPGRA